MKKTITFTIPTPLNEFYDQIKDFQVFRNELEKGGSPDEELAKHLEIINDHEVILKDIKVPLNEMFDGKVPDFDFGDITITSEVTGINEVTWTLDKLGVVVAQFEKTEDGKTNTKIEATFDPKYGVTKNMILKGLWLMVSEKKIEDWVREDMMA